MASRNGDPSSEHQVVVTVGPVGHAALLTCSIAILTAVKALRVMSVASTGRKPSQIWVPGRQLVFV
jgi:hypothetical protein